MESKVAQYYSFKCVNSPRSLSEYFPPLSTSSSTDDMENPLLVPLSALTDEEENQFNKILIPLSPELVSKMRQELFAILNDEFEVNDFSCDKIPDVDIHYARR